MNFILIAGTVTAIIALIGFIISIVSLYIIRQQENHIDRLYSEIEDIKNFLMID